MWAFCTIRPRHCFLVSIDLMIFFEFWSSIYLSLKSVKGFQNAIFTAVYEKIEYICEIIYLKFYHVYYIYQNTIFRDRMKLLFAKTLVICTIEVADSINFLNDWRRNVSFVEKLELNIIKFINKHVKSRKCEVSQSCESCAQKTTHFCKKQLFFLQKNDISKILTKEKK